MLTWNISEWDGAQRISAQAPAECAAWSSADNILAVQLEILRYCPTVVCLQECPSREPLSSLATSYRFIGAAAAHAGFVHLYVARAHGEAARSALPGEPGVACTVDVGDVALTIVALHLPPFEAGADERAAIVRRVVASASQPRRAAALVLAGDLNVREAEAAELSKACSFVDVPYDGFSWNPRANGYYAMEPGERRKCHRFDRVMCRGAVSACAFLVGQCKQFVDGRSFYLSDHFGVLAMLDAHRAHLGQAGGASVRERNRALAQFRQDAALAESHLVRERARLGHEEAALMRARAAERDRGTLLAQSRTAKNKATAVRRRAYREIFGDQSLFRESVAWADGAAPVMPAPPASVALGAYANMASAGAGAVWAAYCSPPVRGFDGAGDLTYAAAVLQLFLRVPALAVWLPAHSGHCAAAAACPACLMLASVRQLGSRRMPELLRHRGLVHAVPDDADGRDAAVFAEQLLSAMRAIEIAAGRAASWPGVSDSQGPVTHLDRLFGFVVETRRQCRSCDGCSSTFATARALHLAVPAGGDGTWTVTELYSVFAQRCDDGGEALQPLQRCPSALATAAPQYASEPLAGGSGT